MSRALAIALLAWASTASGATPDDPGRVAVGYGHACAVRDGRVFCWGGRECEAASRDCWAPVELPWLSGVVELYARGERTCAVDGAGDGWCWDAPRRGVSPWPEPTPVDAVRDLAPPPAASPATPWAWGDALARALRDSAFEPPWTFEHHDFIWAYAWLTNLRLHPAVWATGQGSGIVFGETCALGPGAIECWRDYIGPELQSDWRRRRVEWPAVELVPGGQLACGRDPSGRVWCHRSRTDDVRTEPIVAPVTDVVGLALGAGFTCAALADRTVRCWGRGYGDAPGQVVARDVDAVGIREGFEIPVTAADAPGLAEHADGATVTALSDDSDFYGYAFALLSDGRVFDLDVVRRGPPGPDDDDARSPVVMRDAVQIVADLDDVCARDRRGRVRCLGTPLTTREPPCRGRERCRRRGRPIIATDIALVDSRACRGRWRRPWFPDWDNPSSRSLLWLDRSGRVHAYCAIDGAEWIDPRRAERWADERHEELVTRFSAAFTTALPELGRAEDIAGTGAALCLRRASGDVHCQGWWVDDPATQMLEPGGVSMQWRWLSGRLDLDASAGLEVSPSHVCGLGADRRVRCAGWNLHGQLGAPAINDEVVPIALPGPPIPPVHVTPTDGAAEVAAAFARQQTR